MKKGTKSNNKDVSQKAASSSSANSNNNGGLVIITGKTYPQIKRLEETLKSQEPLLPSARDRFLVRLQAQKLLTQENNEIELNDSIEAEKNKNKNTKNNNDGNITISSTRRIPNYTSFPDVNYVVPGGGENTDKIPSSYATDQTNDESRGGKIPSHYTSSDASDENYQIPSNYASDTETQSNYNVSTTKYTSELGVGSDDYSLQEDEKDEVEIERKNFKRQKVSETTSLDKSSKSSYHKEETGSNNKMNAYSVPFEPDTIQSNSTNSNQSKNNQTSSPTKIDLKSSYTNQISDLSDWSERFRKVLLTLGGFESNTRMHVRKQTNIKLIHLSRDFLHSACIYAKIIISEKFLDDDKKTIKPLSNAGKAGGQKFLARNIFFKFCIDDQNLYSSDEFSMKTGGHELRGLMQYYNCMIPNLYVPMMAVIDYQGFRVVAVSFLPINKTSTLVYGSSDAGNTVISSSAQLQEKLKLASKMLNLAQRKYKGVELYTAADVEGHLVKGKYYYLLDLARVFPPEAPLPKGAVDDNGPERGSAEFLYYLLRPELLKLMPNCPPLCSDSFSSFMGKGSEAREANNNIRLATKYLHEVAVPECAELLIEEVKEYWKIWCGDCDANLWKQGGYLKDFRLKYLVHSRGVNLRHLGRVAEALTKIKTTTEENIALNTMQTNSKNSNVNESPNNIKKRRKISDYYNKVGDNSNNSNDSNNNNSNNNNNISNDKSSIEKNKSKEIWAIEDALALLWIEMASRTLKNMLKKRLRDLATEVKTFSHEEAFSGTVVEFLNLVFSVGVKSETFWDEELQSKMKSKYGARAINSCMCVIGTNSSPKTSLKFSLQRLFVRDRENYNQTTTKSNSASGNNSPFSNGRFAGTVLLFTKLYSTAGIQFTDYAMNEYLGKENITHHSNLSTSNSPSNPAQNYNNSRLNWSSHPASGSRFTNIMNKAMDFSSNKNSDSDGVDLSPQEENVWERENPFDEIDYLANTECVKHMNMINHAQGYVFKLEASQVRYSDDHNKYGPRNKRRAEREKVLLHRALENFLIVLDSDPMNKVTLRNCGQVLTSLDQLENCGDQSIDVKRKSRFDKRPLLQKAEGYYLKAIEFDKEDSYTLYQYATFLYETAVNEQEKDEAEEWYLLSLEADPEHLAALAHFASFLERKGYSKESKKLMDKKNLVNAKRNNSAGVTSSKLGN